MLVFSKCNVYPFTVTPKKNRTLVGNKTVDYLDVFGASPVGAALTQSSFSIW